MQKVLLPPPAALSVYGLTARGMTLKHTVGSLQRFGLTILGQPRRGETFVARWAADGLLAVFDRKSAKDISTAFQFHVEKESFYIQVRDGQAEAKEGTAGDPALTITATNQGFLALASSAADLSAAEKKKQIRLEGPAELRKKFFELFRRPSTLPASMI